MIESIDPLKPIEYRNLDLDTNEFIDSKEVTERYGDGREWWKMELENWENYQHLTAYKHGYFRREDVMGCLKILNQTVN